MNPFGLIKKKKKDESFWEIGVKESGILKHAWYIRYSWSL
jgi:hypothetical protein